MLALALAALLLAAPDDPPAPPPAADAKAVEGLVKELKQAFAGAEVEPMLAAVKKAEALVHADVIAALAKGLKEDRRVQEATLGALRAMDHPAALSELHDTYRRNPAVAEDSELLPLLLKAIGQHGKKESIEVLADEPFATPNPHALEARILGLGRVRDRRSVEELMGMMQKVGRIKSADQMDEFRLALMVLTGADQGRSVESWSAWWNESKKTLKIAQEPPALPEALQRRWDAYWALPGAAEAGQGKEGRGKGGAGG